MGKWLEGTVGCIDLMEGMEKPVVLVEEVEEEEVLEDIVGGCDSACRCESYRDAMVVAPVLSWPSPSDTLRHVVYRGRSVTTVEDTHNYYKIPPPPPRHAKLNSSCQSKQ
jgi:hypothetical protein